MTVKKNMILTASAMHGLGMHLGAWRAREGDATDYVSPDLYIQIARKAEAAKLHAVFFADATSNSEEGTDRPCGGLDPVVILTLMAAVTERLGLVGTASTSYSLPYDLARRFGTLDHLSRGRAGWNAVATGVPAVAQQFGGVDHPNHGDRYARAEEFVDVVTALWDSWEKDALVGNKADSIFARPDGVHAINHQGEFFTVKGPLPFPRAPQGRPVIFQAGSSPEGRAHAARVADVVFTAQHLLDGAIEFRNDIRSRAASFGRNPDHLKVVPGILPILGRTSAEAQARRHALDEAIGIEPERLKLSRRVGLPLDVLKLDEPFPAHLIGSDEEFAGAVGFRRSLVNLAVKKKLTVRELIWHYGGGHQQVVGTAAELADVIEEWLAAGGADGFNLMVDMLPSGFDLIGELLVPELQRRGLFHLDYEHATLRQNLGVGEAEPLAKAVQVTKAA